MKTAGTVLLVLSIGIPSLVLGQNAVSKQAGLKKLPVAVSGQQSDSQKLPLAITDKQAVDEWRRTIYDGTPDPKVPGDTAFLLSLNDQELLGHFRFRQRCAICHAPQADGTPTLGPLLSKKNVDGQESEFRQQIMEGSKNMPGFKLTIEQGTIDAIIAYLKKVEAVRGGPNQDIENSYLRMEVPMSVTTAAISEKGSVSSRAIDQSNRKSVETASK